MVNDKLINHKRIADILNATHTFRVLILNELKQY